MDIMTIAQCGRRFLQNIKTEILQRGHDIAQRQGAAMAVDFQPKLALFYKQPGDLAMVTFHGEQANHVPRSLLGRVATAVIGREASAVAHKHGGGAFFIGQLRQCNLNRWFPSTHHQLQLCIEASFVHCLPTIRQIERIAQQSHAAVVQTDGPT